ncbi:hypothetical protein IT411_04235 [Candidatus Peregrinibacteria bacterium]|nr:hypothetical protein [Candidatus Peregrinibacteria bacterium]
MAEIFSPRVEVKHEGADGHVRKPYDTQVIEVREGNALVARVQYWTRNGGQTFEVEVIAPGSDGIVKPSITSSATLRPTSGQAHMMNIATMNLHPVPRSLWPEVVGYINAYVGEVTKRSKAAEKSS